MECLDLNVSLIGDGDTIASMQVRAVYRHLSRSECEIRVAMRCERMDDRVTGRENGTQYLRVGPNRQRVFFLITAGENDKAARLPGFRKWPGLPARLAATCARPNPDLKNLQGFVAGVEFGMPNAGARAHDLNVACFYAADVAKIVTVRHRPLTDIGDDLDVRVPVERKTGPGGDLIIIPDDQRSQRGVVRFSMVAKSEMVLGLQPTKVPAPEFGPQSWLQHLELRAQGMRTSYVLGANCGSARGEDSAFYWQDNRFACQMASSLR